MIKKALIITTTCLISVFFIIGNFASADYRAGLTIDERVELEREEGNLSPNEVIALKEKYRSHAKDAFHGQTNPAMCITRMGLPVDERVELEREERNLNPNEVAALIKKYNKQEVKNNVSCVISNLRAGLSIDERARLDHDEMK